MSNLFSWFKKGKTQENKVELDIDHHSDEINSSTEEVRCAELEDQVPPMQSLVVTP